MNTQPKPESWRDIAEDAWNELANCPCSIGSTGEIAIILAAITRSHATQMQRSEIAPAGSVDGKFHSQFDMSETPTKASPNADEKPHCICEPHSVCTNCPVHGSFDVRDSYEATPLGEHSEWER